MEFKKICFRDLLTFSLPIYFQCMKSRPNEHLCKFHNCYHFLVSASLEPRLDLFLDFKCKLCLHLTKKPKVNSKRSLVMFSYYLEFKSECTVWKKASLPIARLEIKKKLSCHCKEGRQHCLVSYMNTEKILHKHIFLLVKLYL